MNTPTITAVSRLRTTILVAPDIPLKGGYRKCPRERASRARRSSSRRQSGRFRFDRIAAVANAVIKLAGGWIRVTRPLAVVPFRA